MPLCYSKVGEENIIKKVGGNPEVKKHLEDLGFVVGGSVTVVNTLEHTSRHHHQQLAENDNTDTAERKPQQTAYQKQRKRSENDVFFRENIGQIAARNFEKQTD